MIVLARVIDITNLKEIDYSRIENFEDKEKISAWAFESVKKTIGAGVFNGKTKETIDTNGTFTYAEAATSIRNLLIESGLINK